MTTATLLLDPALYAALADAFPERDGSLEPPRVAQVAPRRADPAW